VDINGTTVADAAIPPAQSNEAPRRGEIRRVVCTGLNSTGKLRYRKQSKQYSSHLLISVIK